MAEALASLQAITVAEELGFHKLVLEGDNLSVIRKINDKPEDRSIISMVINEIKHKSTRFERFIYTFSRWVANQAAHKMGKEGKQ